MKAAVYTCYGPPDVVQIQDIEKLAPSDNEVLIAVRAAALNPLDLVIKGRPYIARLMTGLRTPHVTRIGVDVAGQVEAVGRHVTQFKPGDEVFGACLRDPHAAGVNVWVCQGASLAFLGLVTFERVLQSGIEDLIYARGINRIRHLYQEHAPELRPYFILSSHDDEVGVMGNLAMRSGVWQTFLSTAGMIAVINSVIVGAFVGLLFSALFAALPLGASIGAGVAVFLVSVFLHQRYQWLQGRRSLGALRASFPSGAEE